MTNTLTGILIITICIAPIIYVSIVRRKRKNNLIQRLISETELTHIAEIDVRENYLIALDDTNNSLVFQQLKPKSQITSFNLKAISACEIETLRHSENVDKGERSVIKSISLVLTENNKKVKLMLYNQDLTFVLSNELILSKKWENLINKHIM